MSPVGRFALSRSEVFCNDKGFMITGTALEYLCSVLNSRLTTWYVRSGAPTTGMGVLQWKRFVVEDIPVPDLSPEVQRPFADAGDRILQALAANPAADVTAQEAELNRLVYEFYDLSDDEIRLVEANTTNA